MSNADIRGRFVWHELMTTDPAAATAFYSKIIPWKTQPSGMPSYTLWMSGKTQAGGLMELPAADGSSTPPQWITYIGTPDVDATSESAKKLGGRVLKEAADIPNVGRFAVLSDPQGAVFAVFKPSSAPTEGVPARGAIGGFAWHELATTDPDGALAFYRDLFGWSKGASHDMGEMGSYQIISHEGQDVGGVYRPRDAATPPSWLGYVRVPDVDKATAAVKSGGGRVLIGPTEVPGGSWITMFLDPQGGAAAVVETPEATQPAATAKQAAPAKSAKPAAQPTAASKPAEAPKTSSPAKASAPAQTSGSSHTTASTKAAAAKKAAPGRSAAGGSAKRKAKKTAKKTPKKAVRRAGKAATGKRAKSAGRSVARKRASGRSSARTQKAKGAAKRTRSKAGARKK